MIGSDTESEILATSLNDDAEFQARLTKISEDFLSERNNRKWDALYWTELQKCLISLLGLVRESSSLKSLVISQLSEISEAAVEIFPTYGPCWQLYSEALTISGDRQGSNEVYQRALAQCRSLGKIETDKKKNLFISYCHFVYNDGELFPLLDALTLAADTIGCNIRSRPIWRELLGLRIKIHNAGVKCHQDQSQNGQSSMGFHIDPFVNIESKGTNHLQQHRLFTDAQLHSLVSSTLDLLSVSEEMINEGTLEGSSKTEFTEMSKLSERFSIEQSFDHIRRTYRNWLSSPTSGLNIVWVGYVEFEKALLASSSGTKFSMPSSAAKTLSNRMIASAQTIYTLSEKSYNKLLSKKYFGGFSFTSGQLGSCESPPTPLRAANVDPWRGIVIRWHRIISYELTNPIQLSTPLFIHRMTAIFEACLASCAYHADLWTRYFQFLLGCGNQTRAVTVLQSACDLFLPSDEFLKLTLASYFESIGHLRTSESLLVSLVKASIPAKYHNQLRATFSTLLGHHLFSKNNDKSLEDEQDIQPSVSVLHYVNFIRKHYGMPRAYAIFSSLHQYGPPLELYLYFGRLLWYCNREDAAAKEVLELGLSRFNGNEYYVQGCSELLIEMGLMDAAWILLLDSITRIFQSTNNVPNALWEYLLSVESKYGSSSISDHQRLKLVYSQQSLNIDSEERSLSGATEFLASTKSDDTSIQRFIGPDQFTSPLITSAQGQLLPPQLRLPKETIRTSDSTTESFLRTAMKVGIEEGQDVISQQSALEWKIRMHYAGGSARKLFERFQFQSLKPRTSMIESDQHELVSTKKGESTHIENLVAGDVEKGEEGNYTINQKKNDVLFLEKTTIPLNGIKLIEDLQAQPKQIPHICPDTSKMQRFNPLTSAPAFANINHNTIDISTLPRALQDFINILPIDSSSTLFTNIGDRHPVDVVMTTLQLIPIPNVHFSDYHPLPYASTIHSSKVASTMNQPGPAGIQSSCPNLSSLGVDFSSLPNTFIATSLSQLPFDDLAERSDVFFNPSPNVYRDRLKKRVRVQ